MERPVEFLRGDHFLSRIDARIKLLVLLITLALVLSYRGFTFPWLITLLCLFFIIQMKVPLKVFILRLSESMFIVFIILILKLFFSGTEPLFSIPLFGIELSGYKEGLKEGTLIGSRILSSVSVVALMGFSTPFAELLAGLAWLRIPKGFIEILMFAYRYIFLLLDEAMVIYQAQKNRLGYASFRRGVNSFSALSTSLMFRAFEHSQSITVAMIQRGYDGDLPVLKHKPFRPSEIIASILCLTTLGWIWTIG